MFKQVSRVALVLMAAAGLAACNPGSTPSPSPSAPTSASPSASSGTVAPDTETTAPAPSPSAAPLTPGPGQGNAELSIMVKATENGAPSNFTLVCQNGAPAAESQHPDAGTACTALKGNAAVLSPTKAADQVCTQQYGGPQQATVSGVVDGKPVDASFSLRDGCEISAWNAARAVLGSGAGAG